MAHASRQMSSNVLFLVICVIHERKDCLGGMDVGGRMV